MSKWRDSWHSQVREAQASSDVNALSHLYAELVVVEGAEAASRIWLAEMSGWDAGAITG